MPHPVSIRLLRRNESSHSGPAPLYPVLAENVCFGPPSSSAKTCNKQLICTPSGTKTASAPRFIFFSPCNATICH